MNIPKYKRDACVFVSNLKDITASPDYPITFRRDAYLLSEYYLSDDLLELCKTVKQTKNLLISDNGNFSRIKRIACDYEDQGKQIVQKAYTEIDERGTLSQESLNSRSELIQIIDNACATAIEKQDHLSILFRQVLIKPDYLIGFEDFTIPALYICGMLDPVFSPQASEIAGYQKKTFDLYSRQCHGEYGQQRSLESIIKFLVIHSYDYDSGYQGASEADGIDKDGIAISYGGPLKSRRYINSLNIGDTTEEFDEPLPEPYLTSTALTLGIVAGNREKDIPYHVLGVGSPILIAILGYLLSDSKAISVDSTAPFKDAAAGTIYGSRYALLKMDMYKMAASALISDKPYTSRTPFFRIFEKRFPSDWQGLKEEMNLGRKVSVNELAKELENNNELIEHYIPFFSRMRSGDDEMIRLLRIARSGHNYWILRNICKNILKKKNDPRQLDGWFDKEMKRYKKYGSPKWSKAVAKCHELIRKHR